MDQTKAIEPETRQKLEVGEVLGLPALLVVRAIVPANAEKLAVVLGDGHDVRKLDAGRLATVIKVLVPLDVQIHMAFQQRDVGVQIGRLDTADLVHLLFDF